VEGEDLMPIGYFIPFDAVDRVLHPKKGMPIVEGTIVDTRAWGEVLWQERLTRRRSWCRLGINIFCREQDAWRKLLRDCRRELGIARQQERRANLILRRLMALHAKSRKSSKQPRATR
jgi:hypothetical protein